MKFKDLFADMLEQDVADDIAPYFKEQVVADLDEFQKMKLFVEELEVKVALRNDKD